MLRASICNILKRRHCYYRLPNRYFSWQQVFVNSYLKKNMESKLNLICNILATSNGKDKIIRLFCYSSYFIANWDLTPKNLQKSLILLSSELSKARTISRLFDDLPMLQYSIQCWKSKDQNLMVKINNILDQLYYPVEHLVSINFISISHPLKTWLGFNLGCLKRQSQNFDLVFLCHQRIRVPLLPRAPVLQELL